MSRHDGKVWVRKLRTHYSSHPWEVRARNHNGYDYYETFYDWADAMEAADRLARTREYVLPRLGAAAAEVLSRKGFIPYSPKNAETIALSMLAYRELGSGTSD